MTAREESTPPRPERPAAGARGAGYVDLSVGKALLLATRNFSADGCFNHSAAISYYALLSVIPFLSLVASILGSFLGSSEEGLSAVLERFNMLVPGLGAEMAAAAQSFLGNRSTIGVASGLLTLWVSTFVFFAVETAVGQIFREPMESFTWRKLALRTLWEYGRPFLMFLSTATLLILSFAAGNILTVLRAAAPEVARGIIEWMEAFPSVPYVGSLLFSVAMFALVIQILTERFLHWRVLLPAAVVGGAGWEIAKTLISSYLSYTSSALSFTGSAATVLIFMFWIYYAAAVLLFSIQVAAVLCGQRR